MNKLATYAAAGALALAAIPSVNAATEIRIAGSSAYRSAVHNAIISLLDNASWAYADGDNLGKANAAVFQGTIKGSGTTGLAGGSAVTIYTSWTGSGAGVWAVANNKASTRGWLQLTNSNVVLGTGTSAAGLAKTEITDKASVPDVALSDVAISTTGLTANGLTEPTNSPVGICPFKWLVSGTNSGIKNITSQSIRSLYVNGTIPKSLLTGTAADASIDIYAFGRDADSGTRLTAFAESGLGATFSVLQYAILNNGAYATTSGTIGFAPSVFINGITYDEGNAGYSSGGDLVKSLKVVDANAATAVAYVSVSDASAALQPATGSPWAQELTYNGVPYSTNAVINGQYTFWSYEHLYYRTTQASVAQGAFGKLLAKQIKTITVPADPSYISISAMGSTHRDNDGDVVLP